MGRFKSVSRKRIKKIFLLSIFIIIIQHFFFSFFYINASELNQKLSEIEQLINKKQIEIEKVKLKIIEIEKEKKISDEEYNLTKKRLLQSEEAEKRLNEEREKIKKNLKISIDNLFKKKQIFNAKMKTMYMKTLTKQLNFIIFSSSSISDLHINLCYLSRLIKNDSEIISDLLKRIEQIKKLQIDLENKSKEIKLERNNSIECEQKLRQTSNKLGIEISKLIELENNLKQEIAVLYLEKERLENQVHKLNNEQFKSNVKDNNLQTKVIVNSNNELDSKENVIKNNDEDEKIDISSIAFIWPLKNSKSILRFYGTQKDEKYNVNYFNSGIDISGEYGELVLAALSGKVKFKGEMKSVGKIVIIEHSKNVSTIYSNLGFIDVGMGQKVLQGEVIGRLKEKNEISNNENKPFLHFEIRINGIAKDPMDFL